MARGPYQGTYVHGVRPTVVHSPDALVFINGEPDILGCGECRRRFDWNKYITSIQVDLNVDSAPGSASINLSVPRHSVDDFYFDGVPLLTPMMEVEIYAKGYFNVEGLPQYYPIFWGLITEVSESYSGGEHSLSLNCSDILKWWELCKMNVNPAFTQAAGQKGRSIFGNVFYGTNPYDLIWTLASQAFGDVVVGSGSLVSLYKEGQQRSTFQNALSSIMLYWQERFTQIRSNLLLYGTSGNVVRGDVLQQEYRSKRTQDRINDKQGKLGPFASAAVRRANGGASGGQTVFDPTDKRVTAFRTQFSDAGQVNFFQSEYQTKLELANAAKEVIGFEFYMDVTGDIVFKPPFYNLDVLGNKPVSWIQDIDIIDWDLADSEAEVVTQIQMQGAFGGNVDYGFPAEATPFTSVTDYHLLRKYGWRTQTFNSEFMGSPLAMFYVGLDMLDRYNARRHRATLNIPLRPELRMGFPVYLASKDQIWYVNGISHNIQFGGRAQTTLSLTARRTKFVAPQGIGTIKLKSYKGGGQKGEGAQKDQEFGNQTGSNFTSFSSRQLQTGGVFEADVTDAAQVPEQNAPRKPGPTVSDGQDKPIGPAGNGANPYAPVVIRHPKTGRVVGWPNVVMAYTRPFQNVEDDALRALRGQKRKAAQRVPNKIVKGLAAEKGKAAKAQLDELARATGTANNDDRLREKHLTNRYTYGLNSAGVYVYLHNTDQRIEEMLIVPSSNIEYKGDKDPVLDAEGNQVFENVGGQKVPVFKNRFSGASGMIRPVSDNRGFEVIGHWRYGRGVKLRDGALILNEEGGVNGRAFIQTQVALTGTLFDALKAQSSGLSTISTPFATNPVDAITKMQPEDLQTAGIINPETDKPEFKTAEENFVATAPLGSKENQGLEVNVEASQLSRALTLAEMSVREDTQARKECSCVLGRPDLNFINLGYQVQTLRASSEDATTLGFGAAGSALDNAVTSSLGGAAPSSLTDQEKAAILQAQAIRSAGDQAAIEAGNSAAEFAALSGEDPDAARERAAAEARAEAEAEAQAILEALPGGGVSGPPPEVLEEALTQGTGLFADTEAGQALAEALDANQPVQNLALSIDELQSTVENFLAGLYSALDTPHQELEHALRGDYITKQNPTEIPPDRVRFASPNTTGFNPPFSSPNRAIGGDPAALALQGQSAVNDLVETWGEFGGKLEANIQRTKLEAQIAQLQQKITDLLNEAAALNEQQQDGPTSVTVTPGGTEVGVSSRLEEIEMEVAELQQQLANKQQKLNNLNQEFPC